MKKPPGGGFCDGMGASRSGSMAMLRGRCSGAGVDIELELPQQVLERGRFLSQRVDGGGGFLDHRRVSLGVLIDLVDRAVDVANAA